MGWLFALLSLTACDAGVPAKAGTKVTFDDVCDKGNEGKRVSLEGFLDFPARFNAKASSIVMRFHAAPSRSARAIGARTRLSAGSNTVIAPPDRYNETDLKVITHDGKFAGYRTRLKLTGIAGFSDSLETRDFTCFIKDVRIELAGVAAAQ